MIFVNRFLCIYLSLSATEVCPLHASDSKMGSSDITQSITSPEIQGNYVGLITHSHWNRRNIIFDFVTSFKFSENNDLLMGIDRIAWPFIISGAWCIFFSFGYAMLGNRKYLD